MKKVLLTFCVATLVLVIAGCGGGTETTAPEGGTAPAGQTGTGVQPPPPPASSSTTGTSEEISEPAKFASSAETPASFKQALGKKKPICVEFYLPGDPKTADVNREIRPLKKEFARQVTFISYDVNNASTTAAISEQLEAGYAPFFVIVDKDGYVVYRHSGFIDRLTLEQQLFSTLRR